MNLVLDDVEETVRGKSSLLARPHGGPKQQVVDQEKLTTSFHRVQMTKETNQHARSASSSLEAPFSSS